LAGRSISSHDQGPKLLTEPPEKPASSRASVASDNASAVDGVRVGVRIVEVTPDHAGQRIDNFLISELKTVPRSLVYRLLRTGQVRVNKGRIKPHFRLSEGDSVRIPPVTVPTQEPARIPREVTRAVAASVIHEDENWIVVNKPDGLAVHGGSGLNFGLVDVVKSLFEEPSISLVHRLDRATSGVMVMARTRKAAVHFHESLINGCVQKNYLAVLCGVLREPQSVSAKLKKTHPTANENQVVVDEKFGKEALSHFRCQQAGARLSLAEVEIETGRTHQIRVHAALIGHPVLGDERYGNEVINREVRVNGARRMYLHAHKITFPNIDTSSPAHKFSVEPDKQWREIITL